MVRVSEDVLHSNETLTRSSRLVLETLAPLPGDRKCFRMINGVLTERTVKDVLPTLQTNAEGLKKVLEDLVNQYTGKQTEMEKWKVRSTITRRFAPLSGPLLTSEQKKNNIQVVQQ